MTSTRCWYIHVCRAWPVEEAPTWPRVSQRRHLKLKPFFKFLDGSNLSFPRTDFVEGMSESTRSESTLCVREETTAVYAVCIRELCQHYWADEVAMCRYKAYLLIRDPEFPPLFKARAALIVGQMSQEQGNCKDAEVCGPFLGAASTDTCHSELRQRCRRAMVCGETQMGIYQRR